MAYIYTPYQKKEYQQSQGVQNAQAALQQHQQNKPGDYSSKYREQIEKLYGQIQNRPDFRYNVNEDALYQSMVQRYQQQGRQAMMDTMGQAAALTGGYGNSYAQSVGQQTYQGYLQSLADLVPDYYQMALQAYQAKGDDLYKQYSMAMDQEGQDYSRWQDANNAYLQELARLQGVYESERDYDYNKWLQDENFNYGLWKDDQDTRYQQNRDAVSDERYNQEWLYQQERDSLSDKRYDQEWLYQQERDRIADEQWQKQFAESQRQYNENMEWQREQAAARSYSSGGGGGRSSGRGGNSSGSYVPSYNQVKSEYINMTKNGQSASSRNKFIEDAVADGAITKQQGADIKSIYQTSTKRYTAADKMWERNG